MENFEIDFEGELSDGTKREIDCLVEGGFDPERALENHRQSLLREQENFNLLLPESCKPTIGEIAIAPGQLGEEASIADIEAYLEKLLLDLPPSSTFMLDFREENYLIAAEIVLSRLKNHLKNNYIRWVITKETKEAVQRAQQEAWRRRAGNN
jgi:hypothetical protein